MSVREEVTPQIAQSGRARGISAAISGAFAVVWLGWGKADDGPLLLTQLLQIGRGLCVVVAILGLVLALRSPASSTPMTDPGVRRGYGMVVGLEFALLAVGNIVLAHTGLAEWIPVWVCAGVGVHFIPMSRIFAEGSLMILGAMMTAVAAAALVVGLTSAVAPSTIAGAGAGVCLLVYAAITLFAKRFYSAVG